MRLKPYFWTIDEYERLLFWVEQRDKHRVRATFLACVAFVGSALCFLAAVAR